MKKYLLLLLVPLVLYGCTPEKVRIRSEKRISVTGKVVDGTAQGIPEIPVVASGALGGNVSGSPYQVLGLGRSTNSGDLRFVSLDTYNSDFTVTVNPRNSDFYTEDYATVYFINLEDDLGVLLKLDQVELPKKVNFSFSVLNTSGATGEIAFSIKYARQEIFFQIIRGSVSNEAFENYPYQNFRTIQDTHNVNGEVFSEVIPTIEGSEIIFTYSFGDEESGEIIVPVTQNGNYVFEY